MFKSRNWKVFFLGLSFFLAFGLVAYGQETGTITGSVLDPSGAVIPNASVSVTNDSTSAVFKTTTGSAGIYRVVSLTPGSYTVKAEAKGFKTTLQRGVTVNVGEVARIDLSMQLGQEVQTVTVEAGAQLVSTEEARLTNVVRGEQIANLALNGRNVFDLIKLAPGAVNVSGVMFENGAGVVVNGVRENFNGFIMNGVSNKGLSGGVVTTPNQDIVAEFQVNTLNMSAQYGNSAGAITNLVTKSGSNAFHGDFYEYLRNDALDASDFFTNQANQKKRNLRFNQFGGSGGGSIIKDKTFFYVSYQGERTLIGSQPQPIVAETAAWRQAVQGALPNSVAALLYSNFPSPAGVVTSTVDSFVSDTYGDFGTLLCPDNFSPSIAQSFQTLFGVTAAEAAGCSGLVAGQNATQAANRLLPFQQQTTASFPQQGLGNLFNGNEWSVRVDHSFMDGKSRIFGQYYNISSTDKFGPANVSNVRGFTNPFAGVAPNAAFSWTYIISPTAVNEFKAGFSRSVGDLNVSKETFNVPSIAFGSGDIGFGSYNGYPQLFHENIYTYSDMLSITRGKHALKFGADLRRNIENSDFNVGRPSYYFFDNLFFAADAPAEQANGVDPGIITGQPASLATNNRAWRNIEFGWFAQDDWKVNSHLTLNLGIRWDLYTRHVEKFNRATRFIPGPGTNITETIRNANIPAGLPGCDSAREIRLSQIADVCGPGGFSRATSLGTPDHNNWGPRFGFAYDPTGSGKMAIRGGMGVSYEGTLYNPLSNSRWNLPFYSFNIVDNFLFGDVNNVVYGPTTRDASGNLIPSGAAPSFSSGSNPGQGDGSGGVGTIVGYDSNAPNLAFLTGIIDPTRPGGLKDPYVYSYFFGIQRQLSRSTGIEINYVGTTGHKLFRAQSANRNNGGRLPIPGTCAADYGSPAGPDACSNRSAVNSFGRANPNYGRLRVWQNAVNSNYNSLQLGITRKMSRGLAFNANYTWGHSIDGGSDWHSGATSANGSAAGDAFNLDTANPGLDRGNSTFDFRHRLVANYVWEFPWFKSQQGFAGHVLGGWQTSGLWSFQTGAHWTAYDSRARSLRCSLGGSANSGGAASACLAAGGTIFNAGGDYNLDGEANDRPDVLTTNTVQGDKEKFANGYFGQSAIAAGFFGTPCLGCNGNLGRNTFEGPPLFTSDLSLFKTTNVTERLKVQFRADFFNAFNRSNFKIPSSSTGANFSNRIQSPIFGSAAGTFDPRQIQFSLKVLF